MSIENAEDRFIYLILGLASEAGEVADKVKKLIRDNPKTYGELMYFLHNGSPNEAINRFRDGIEKELGDVLWYISAISTCLRLSLNEVAEANLYKLQSREERGVIGGSGDDR
jgi:NTP pyrophosphatase (non-canonical NTP hydrolase)